MSQGKLSKSRRQLLARQMHYIFVGGGDKQDVSHTKAKDGHKLIPCMDTVLPDLGWIINGLNRSLSWKQQA